MCQKYVENTIVNRMVLVSVPTDQELNREMDKVNRYLKCRVLKKLLKDNAKGIVGPSRSTEGITITKCEESACFQEEVLPKL